MADSKIQWTQKVWNPIRGCRKVSAGCANCYAERMAARFSGPGQPYDGLVFAKRDGRAPGWTGEARFFQGMLAAPLHWRKPSLVFVNSMSDLFHEDIEFEEIDAVFGVMWACLYLGRDAIDGHTFQILTKRPARMVEYFSTDRRENWATHAVHIGGGSDPDGIHDQTRYFESQHPRIHLGVSVENQAAADERIPLLLQCPAAVRWVSCEPLLGPVNLDDLWGERRVYRGDTVSGYLDYEPALDWVVCGGESGPNARQMHPDWARSLRDQCRDAGVPFWFKQWGEWRHTLDGKVTRVGKRIAGNTLDGVRHEMRPGEKWGGVL